jgi:sulfite reductase (NADPH) flavoprotein alpha-component
MSVRAASSLRTAAIWGNSALLAALAALALWLLRLQGQLPAWSAPDAMRGITAALATVAWFVLCGLILRRRMRIARADVVPKSSAKGVGARSGTADHVLVVHASQTGFAEQLARQTAESLRHAGIETELRPLARIDVAGLVDAGRVLFVASTTGEGDAPDAAAAFVHSALAEQTDLRGLRYGLLALGDRDYRNYCAFGHRLDTWLRKSGAEPIFDLVEVDNGDEGALRHWQHHLGQLAGDADLPDWSAPEYARWHLRERRRLNPGSVGGACFHLELVPADGLLPEWRAGDIAEIGPCNAASAVDAWLRKLGLEGGRAIGDGTLRDLLARSALPATEDLHGLDARTLITRLRPLPHREYSIASIPRDGAIHLLVRRMPRPDGSPGLGSGWLTEYALPGADIALRIRANPNFHAPDDDRPLILIGNGSGIAGLRALLKQRVATGARRNWLLFGERNAAQDFHYRDDILHWQAQGFIERLDLAFSRDQSERIYVQQRLAESSAQLRAWVTDGAALYVCGSLEGMAPGVHAALVDALGADAVERLQVEGRYRRDVY